MLYSKSEILSYEYISIENIVITDKTTISYITSWVNKNNKKFRIHSEDLDYNILCTESLKKEIVIQKLPYNTYSMKEFLINIGITNLKDEEYFFEDVINLCLINNKNSFFSYNKSYIKNCKKIKLNELSNYGLLAVIIVTLSYTILANNFLVQTKINNIIQNERIADQKRKIKHLEDKEQRYRNQRNLTALNMFEANKINPISYILELVHSTELDHYHWNISNIQGTNNTKEEIYISINYRNYENYKHNIHSIIDHLFPFNKVNYEITNQQVNFRINND